MEDNKYLDPTYYQSVMAGVRNDPIEFQRMVGGVWVDKPSGTALFSGSYFPDIHVVGDAKKRALPFKGFPIILGYDIGQVYHAIVFEQFIVTEKGATWLVFDEVIHDNKKMHLKEVTRSFMQRMAFWNRTCEYQFAFQHFSDNSAFNQYRNATGSYDFREIEQHSETIGKSLGIDPIRMKPAPKFQGSVEARVRLVLQLLQNENLLISGACSMIKQMFLNLEAENQKLGKYDPSIPFTPKRSKYLHCFDAMSYPILTLSATTDINSPISRRKTDIIEVGGNR